MKTRLLPRVIRSQFPFVYCVLLADPGCASICCPFLLLCVFGFLVEDHSLISPPPRRHRRHLTCPCYWPKLNMSTFRCYLFICSNSKTIIYIYIFISSKSCFYKLFTYLLPRGTVLISVRDLCRLSMIKQLQT